MSTLARIVLTALIAVALIVPPVPVNNAKAGFMSFGVKDELELGRKFNALVRSKMPLIDDPVIEGYVRDLVMKIAAHIPPQPFSITVGVIQNPAVNAFAAPAGYVFVFSGLVLNFDHESEVASVLAHELGHVAQRHIAQRMENAQTVGIAGMLGMVAGMVLGAAAGAPQAGAALAMGSQAASQTAMLAYSRDNEREADQVGMGYLIAAGYPPQSMVHGFETLRRLRWFKGGGTIPSYLNTHPDIDERITYLSDRVSHMPKWLQDRKESDERFMRVKTLLRAQYTDTDTALAFFDKPKAKPTCLDKLGRAIVLSRVSRVNDAKAAFDEALACAPKDALFLREAGRFYYKLGNFAKAVDYLQRSADLDPHDAMTLGYLGWTLHSSGQKDKGKLYMQRAIRELPEDIDLRSVYGRMAGENGDLFTAYLNLTYAAVFQNNKQQAAYNMEKVKPLAKTEDQKQDLAQLEKIYKERSEFWKPKLF